MSMLMNPPEEHVDRAFAQTRAKPAPADRLLPILCHEPRRDRWIGLLVLLIVVCFYAVQTLGTWAPADGGVDQNAYLLGGRMLAEHFTTRYTLPNPYAYVGNMMIRTSDLKTPGGDYYPKYPIGLPLMYAMFFWIAGATKAAKLAFLVSPVCSILAVTGLFFLTRVIAGSFSGVMAAILLGSSQLMITLSNNPNSHASCTAFIVWGMYCLIKWWQTGKLWLGVLAGLLIGYAGLIRYSEALLVLPIAVTCASRLRWTNWRSYLRAGVPGFTWAVPIASLFIFNKCTMGNWTGYDSTNESEGFTWIKFTHTWEQMIRTYYDMGAFFVLPLGLAGLLMIARRSWALSAMLLLWLLPGTALYTSYYWSPDRGVSYARFILTFTPAIMLGTAICFSDGFLHGIDRVRWYRRFPQVLAVGMVVAISAGLGTYRAVHGLQQGSGSQGGGGLGGNSTMPSVFDEFRVRQSLANIGSMLLDHVPVNAVVFADNSAGNGGGNAGGNAGGSNERPLNYLQFLRHWDLYSTDAFDVGGGSRSSGGGRRINFGFGANPDPQADPNAAPTTRQPLQIAYTNSLYQGKSSSDLRTEFAKVVDGAHQAKHAVFALVSTARDREIRRNFNLAGKYKITTVAVWTDLDPGPPDPVLEQINNGRRPGGAGGGRRTFGTGASTLTPTTWELLQIKPVG